MLEWNTQHVRRLAAPRSYGRASSVHLDGVQVNWDECTAYGEAHGTSLYTVEISWEDGTPDYYECDCPDDRGGACKHATALMLYVLDMQDSAPSGPQKQQTNTIDLSAFRKPKPAFNFDTAGKPGVIDLVGSVKQTQNDEGPKMNYFDNSLLQEYWVRQLISDTNL